VCRHAIISKRVGALFIQIISRVMTRHKEVDNSEDDAIERQPAASPRKLLIMRFVLALVLGGLGVPLIVVGKQTIQNRSYDFTWESHGASFQSDHVSRTVTRGAVQLQGSDAVEHGVGLLAAGVTFEFWSILVLLSLAGGQSAETPWRGIYSVAAFLSLAGVTSAMIAFFPPWHVPSWPSCDALYIILLFCIFLACLRDRKRVLYFSQRGFPVLILAGILLGQVTVGALAGTIAGIFFGLVLAIHVTVLVPGLRKKAEKIAAEEPS
jgi:hypothetical protein